MSILRFALSSLVIASLFSSSPALATMEDPYASTSPMPSASPSPEPMPSPDDGRPPEASFQSCGNATVEAPEECDYGTSTNGTNDCPCGLDCHWNSSTPAASGNTTEEL